MTSELVTLDRTLELPGAISSAAAVLPSLPVLNKVLRYETKLERQMYRAMTQLERVQRLRRGEAVPAPLSGEVADRNERNGSFAKRTHLESAVRCFGAAKIDTQRLNCGHLWSLSAFCPDINRHRKPLPEFYEQA